MCWHLYLASIFQFDCRHLLDKRVGRVGVTGPGDLLLHHVSVKGVVRLVLGNHLCWCWDVHHTHVVLFGNARTGGDGVRVTSVTFHGWHAKCLPHTPPEVCIVHRVKGRLGCCGAKGDPGNGREEQQPLPWGSLRLSGVPQLSNEEWSPSEEGDRVQHEKHLDGFDFSPWDNVHGPTDCVTIAADPPDEADHALVEPQDQGHGKQETK